MAKLADARDLKSRDTRVSYRFDPGFRHHYIAEWSSPVARRAHNPKVMWFKSHLRNQTKEKQPIGLFFHSVALDSIIHHLAKPFPNKVRKGFTAFHSSV